MGRELGLRTHQIQKKEGGTDKISSAAFAAAVLLARKGRRTLSDGGNSIVDISSNTCYDASIHPPP